MLDAGAVAGSQSMRMHALGRGILGKCGSLLIQLGDNYMSTFRRIPINPSDFALT